MQGRREVRREDARSAAGRRAGTDLESPLRSIPCYILGCLLRPDNRPRRLSGRRPAPRRGKATAGSGSAILPILEDARLMPPMLESRVPGFPCRRGKVRDVYDLGDRLVIVATDRISAFDWVLPTPIPDKGRVLTALTLFWLETLAPPNHLLSTDVRDMPPAFAERAAELEGRTCLVRKARVAPIECVVRGYLAGSGWKEYRADREGVRRGAAAEPAPERTVADRRSSRRRRRRNRVTTRTFRSRRRRGSSAPTRRPTCATGASTCTGGRRTTRGRAA